MNSPTPVLANRLLLLMQILMNVSQRHCYPSPPGSRATSYKIAAKACSATWSELRLPTCPVLSSKCATALLADTDLREKKVFKYNNNIKKDKVRFDARTRIKKREKYHPFILQQGQ